MICDECEQQRAALHCSECGQELCSDCDASLHLKGKRRAHVRVSHSTRTGKDTDTSLAVYWDASVLCPQSQAELQCALTAVTGKQPADVRVYSSHFLSLAKEMRQLGLSLIVRQGLSVYESIIMDISLKVRTSRPAALILLSASEGLFRSFLGELARAVPELVIIYGKGTVPISLFTLDGFSWTPAQVGVPSEHQLTTSKLVYKELTDALRALADKGQVQTPVSSLGVPESILQSAHEEGLVHIQSCPWDATKERLVGLKVLHPSVELLQWTFKAVRVDQVTPSEVYIKELLAAAFGYQPAINEWQSLLRLPQFPLLITAGIDTLTCLPARIFVPKGEEAWKVVDGVEVEEEVAMPSLLESVLATPELKPGKDLYSWLRPMQFCISGVRPPLGSVVRWVRRASGVVPRCPLPTVEEAQLASLDLLSSSPDGLALASLPHLLAYKFCRPINAAHFGLTKLTDLFEGIPDLKVEIGDGAVQLTGHSSLTSTSDGEMHNSPTAPALWEQMDETQWSQTQDLLDYYEPHLKVRGHSYSRSADLRTAPRLSRITLPSFGSVFDMATSKINSGRLDTLSEEDSSSPQLDDKQSSSPSPRRESFDSLSK